MAWIESHIDLGNHPKLTELCFNLMIKKHEAIGHLHLLWHFTMKYASKSGDLLRYAPRVICEAVGWEKDAEIFIQALQDTGFLEKGSLKVHDWDDYALHYHLSLERTERQRNQVRERVRNWRDRRSNAPVTLGNADVTKCNADTLPNQTKPLETLSTKVDSKPAPTPENLISLWNTKAHPNLPRVELLTERRKIHIKARLKDHPDKSFWESLVDRVNNSPLLRGENGHNWKCTFDWILNINNMAKILEGNYDQVKKHA